MTGILHASVHADGRWHFKSYDQKVLERQAQRPNQDFRGSQSVWTILIPPADVRALNMKCTANQFSDVFEIQIGELETAKHPHILSGSPRPEPPIGTLVIRRHTLRDVEP